ncbi:hypothetical protein MBLNU459_g0150t1 [Dothideomycetes sp. NU459]
MPFSHHSHSGQFCGHAVNTLEEMVRQAISLGMSTLALTEHIPRGEQDLYPEEENTGGVPELIRLFDAFYPEAVRLREKYASQINILVGFESEWIRSSSLDIVQNLLQKYKFDMFMGSLHHVHTKPIDYDHDMYYEAREIAGGTDEQLFGDYFDSQLEMLQALKPPVVGHFDLIRLKSDDPERNWLSMPKVWSKIERNLGYVASYGGILELNSSAIRKGMTEPYPKAEICEAYLKLGGRFTLSDDSHGTDQIGLNFGKVLQFLKNVGIQELHYLTSQTDNSFDTKRAQCISVSGLEDHKFWKSQP